MSRKKHFTPSDWPLSVDKLEDKVIEQAIHCYCKGDDKGLESGLKKISYRSPYRDLRFILTGLILISDAPEKAADIFAKVSNDSPFSEIANAAQAIALNAEDLPSKLMVLGPLLNQWAAVIKGINSERLSILTKLDGATLNNQQLFKLLITNKKLFSEQRLQAACYELLPTYTTGLKVYNSHFGPLSEFECFRIKALATEQKHDLSAAKQNWEAAIETLLQEPTLSTKQSQIALILRHLSVISEELDGPDSDDAVVYLEKSLDYDTDDKDCHLKLIQWYKKFDDKKAYRLSVEAALKQFPQDGDILFCAIELALARNTFKKAARLATILLKKDPVNTRVRHLLINAHLSHARKQIREGKFELVEKELEQAQLIEHEDVLSGIILIHQGLLVHASGYQDESDVLIEKANRCIGNYRETYFCVVVEAERVDIVPKLVKKYTKLLKGISPQNPIKTEVLSLVGTVRRYLIEGDANLDTPLKAISKYLAQSAELDYSFEEMEMICELFLEAEAYDLLHAFSTRAVRQWQDEPLFIYFQVIVKTTGDPMRMSSFDAERLDRARINLLNRNDPRNADRISEFLNQVFLSPRIEMRLQ